MITWMRKNMKAILITVAVIFTASIFYGLGMGGFRGERERTGKSEKRILAKVNGKEIDPLRFREILSRTLGNIGEGISPSDLAFFENLALGQTLDFTLMLSEAKKKVRVSGREIEATFKNIMQSEKFPSKKEFEAALKRNGLTLSKFKDLLRDEILVQKLSMKMREEVKVAPEDLREIRAAHILLTSEATAQSVWQALKKGKDFAPLAKQFSTDPGSKDKSGDLGFFTTGMMVEPFEKAAFALKVGEISSVVKSPFGYHLIKVTDSRLRKFPGKEKDIEKAALEEKQQQAFRRWYSEVKGKAKIEILDPILKGHSLRFQGRPAEALAEYKKALTLYSTNAYLHVYLGETLMGLGQKDLALQEYEKAIAVDSGNPYLYLIFGDVYKREKKNDLALKQYQKASLITGDNKALHQKLLKIFQDLKRGKEASHEEAEIKRIEKKEKFEAELKGETKGK